MKSFVVPLSLVFGLGVTAASATTVVYTDQTTFLAGLQNVVVEDFDDGTVDAPISVTAPSGAVGSGQWNDQINEANPPTIWSFSSAMNGFGGLFDLAGPGGPGVGILLTLGLVGGGTEVVLAEIPNSNNGTFWGFISDLAFNTVSFTEGTQANGIETYSLDNLTVGVAPVPLPAGFGLLFAAVGGLAAVRRMKRR